MNIPEILNLPFHKLKVHIDLLSNDYKEKTGRTVCRSCASDIQQMITTLKIAYKMTQFELDKTSVIYKVEKGKGETISNDKMTDELAIQFLTINPDRIRLFSKYPENWKELIGLELAIEEVENTDEVIETPELIDIKPIQKNKKICASCKKKSTTKTK